MKFAAALEPLLDLPGVEAIALGDVCGGLVACHGPTVQGVEPACESLLARIAALFACAEEVGAHDATTLELTFDRHRVLALRTEQRLLAVVVLGAASPELRMGLRVAAKHLSGVGLRH
jgi:hypothetical protein